MMGSCVSLVPVSLTANSGVNRTVIRLIQARRWHSGQQDFLSTLICECSSNLLQRRRDPLLVSLLSQCPPYMTVRRSIKQISDQLRTLGTAGRVGAGLLSVAVAGRLAYAVADTVTYPLQRWPEVRSPLIFCLGFGTGVAAYAMIASPQSVLTLGRQPAKIYSQSFRAIRHNKDIQIELGSPIKFGGFRQLHFVPGSVDFNALTASSSSLTQRLASLWCPRETHLLYLIHGPHGTAIVNLNDRYGKHSCQVVPTKGDVHSIIVTGSD